MVGLMFFGQYNMFFGQLLLLRIPFKSDDLTVFMVAHTVQLCK